MIRVGRFAGQYAKPRSEDLETRGGVTLPSYRGDLVNRVAVHAPRPRRPDPELLLRGYERAALTLNFIRSLIDGGFADLHHPEYWDLDFVQHSPLAAEYQRIVDAIGESLSFMESARRSAGRRDRAGSTSSPATRGCSSPTSRRRRGRCRTARAGTTSSTHFPWIGMRTAEPDGAHVEFFRGITQPDRGEGRAGDDRARRSLELVERPRSRPTSPAG